MVNNVCVIIRHPLGDERFTLGLRTALATQMEGFDTYLVFSGNAVLSLSGTMPGYPAQTLSSYLENEGKLYVLDRDLQTLKLEPSELSSPLAKVVDSDELSEVLEDSDAINTF